jgi:anti-sigma B factor antagonist
MPSGGVEARMKVDTEQGVAIIRPPGSLLGFEETDELIAAANGLLERGNRCLVVDLDRVDQINAIGLSTLVRLLKGYEKQQAYLKLCCLNPKIRTVFEITKLDYVFQIYADRAAAIASFAPGPCPEG